MSLRHYLQLFSASGFKYLQDGRGLADDGLWIVFEDYYNLFGDLFLGESHIPQLRYISLLSYEHTASGHFFEADS